ncbi:MAG: DUF192 domain-containing protein [Candidatus Eremiobacteraeota bacterium]|nr:DUF192 domain-containing protein [Candidatus Eremiobacteraeota bacterium]
MSRLVHKTLTALAFALAFGLETLPSSARADDSAPIDKACASPRLPSEILDGPFSSGGTALRVVTARVGSTTLRLAVAADPENREFGLMCVTRLRVRHGMVFVFPSTGEWDFWMKNTLVPLDMIWVTSDGTVASVAAGVPASTRATLDAAVARRAGSGLYTI